MLRNITYCSAVQTFATIIGRWPSAVALAEELGANPVNVRAWRRRGIPAAYWLDLIEIARRDGVPLTLEDLARVEAARGRPRQRPRVPA
jgi:hypothetical protein